MEEKNAKASNSGVSIVTRGMAGSASLVLWSHPLPSLAQVSRTRDRPVGPGSTIVHTQFGGQIFGFDIDQNGTEGVLSESQTLSNGDDLAAVETFDQASGEIVKTISKIESLDDFVTLGVTGGGVGLVEREHVQGIYVVKRFYGELNPLSGNELTGLWTPPLNANDIILGISRNQDTPTTAVLFSRMW